MADIQYINSDIKLQDLLSKLKNVSKIAVDLEFDNNHHHYGFSLCLMQIYCGSAVYLVDPKEVDIKLIFPFFENKNIQIVVFSFGEDMRLLHSLGCNTNNIYDISTAIKLLNYEKISLGDALEFNMNLKLEKGSQKSDWCRRPFTEKQMIYAANDVLYLFHLQELVEKQAKEKGISQWISQENKAMEKAFILEKSGNKIKKKDRYGMTEFQWFFYQKLWNFREVIAKKLDKPAHQVINNNFLKEITQDSNLIQNWQHNKYIHHSIKTYAFGQELQQLLQQAKMEATQQNISKTEREIKPTSKEDYIKVKFHKKQIDHFKETIFKPIHDCIRRDYGEFAVTHILSNRQVENIINKKPILEYKRDLIIKYGKELGVDISLFL